MKTCTLCNKTLESEFFNKKTSYYDGLSPWCKSCTSAKNKTDYKLTKEQKLAKSNEYYKNNREDVLERRKNDPSIKVYMKEWRQNNHQHIQEYNTGYKSNNGETIRIQRKTYRSQHREEINEYTKEKLKIDPLFKLGKMLRARLRDFLKNGNNFNKRQTADYIGCTMEQLKVHIEKQFKDGMTWENHAELWHLDHIIPLAHAKTEDQLYELARWTNLQPLTILKNLKKNKHLPKDVCWQKLRRDNLLQEDINNDCPIDVKAIEFDLAYESFGDEHRKFIERYEWLGTCGFGPKYAFTARYKGLLGGVILIGEPNSYQFGEVLEALIHRGACASWTPKNLASRLIMFSCRWMLNNTSKRIFTAYSDPEAGEIGTVYQACNFDYLGAFYGAEYSYKLSNGQLVSSRYFTRTSTMKKWAKELNITWLKEWNKPNGFQDINAMPPEIYQQLKDYAKVKKDTCIKTKKAPKGKYVLLLTKKCEKIEKTWKSELYPKRKQNDK